MVLVIGSAFADVRFSGFAKVLWGYDFNNQKFTVSGKDYASIRETYNYGKIYNTSAAANLTVKVVGDWGPSTPAQTTRKASMQESHSKAKPS